MSDDTEAGGAAAPSPGEDMKLAMQVCISEDDTELIPPRQPLYVVLLPSLAFAGVQLAWGVQVSPSTPAYPREFTSACR